MSEWHQILTKAVNTEKAFLSNKKEYRLERIDSSFNMSIGSKTYSLGGTKENKDPFIKEYEQLAEKIKNEDKSIEDVLTEELKRISNQAYLAEDPLVLQSVFRMVKKAQDAVENPEFGQQFLNNLLLPASVKVQKRNFFLSSKPVEKVRIYQEKNELGSVSLSKFHLLPGKYKFEYKDKKKEERIIDHHKITFQLYKI